jgi:hypothetical protein
MCCRVLTSSRYFSFPYHACASSSHITYNYYLTCPITPSATFFGTTGTPRKEQISSIFRRCSTVRSNPSYFQSPTLRAASVSTALYTYKHIPLQYSLFHIISPKILKLSDEISSSAKYARKTYLGRDTSISHHRRPSKSPAHARARHTHLCAESSLRTHKLDFDIQCI